MANINDVVIKRADLEALVKSALWRHGKVPVALVRQIASKVEPLYYDNTPPGGADLHRLSIQRRDEVRGVIAGMGERFDRARNHDKAATPETVRQSRLSTTRDPVQYMKLTDVHVSAVQDIRSIVEALGRGMGVSGKDPSTVIVDGGVGMARGHPVDHMSADELWTYSCVYLPWSREEGRRPVRTGNAAAPRPTALEVVLRVLIDRRSVEEMAGAHVLREETVRTAFRQSLQAWHSTREQKVRHKGSWMRRNRDAA